jgi:sugar phosphate isomerase/epimerase
MWAQQDRFFNDMHAFANDALAMGFDAIEVAHSLPPEPFERLVSYAGLPLSSIHAPAPLTRDAANRANSSLNLASTGEDERRAAIDATKHSIDLTHQYGGKYVVVHLGGVGTPMFDAERDMRRLYDSGTHDGERMDALREQCYRQRADTAEPWLAKARETLRELVAHAAPHGIAIGIENRLHYHEIPQPDEAASLLADFAPAEAGYWHDVGHAEVQWRLGFVDKRRWLDTNGPRCIGCHLHDVTGLADHRAPGNGDVEWDYIAKGIPAAALRVFEINQSQPAEAVASAIPFLRARGDV